MKARDFCFWLQGYFELNATPNYILELAATRGSISPDRPTT